MKKIVIGIVLIVLIVSTLLIITGLKTENIILEEVEEKNIQQEIEMKIIKVNKIERPEANFTGLEVEFSVNGEIKRECFVDYDYWIEKVDGEERFIKRLRENHLKDAAQIQKEFEDDQINQSNIINEMTEFKNKEI